MGESLNPKIIPTAGRVVYYKLSQQDAEQINKRRDDASRNLTKIKEESIGYQAHVGNTTKEGDICVMIVTAVWSDTCTNGKVLLDGNDDFWATSCNQGELPGNWDWMPFQKASALNSQSAVKI